jgi:transposase
VARSEHELQIESLRLENARLQKQLAEMQSNLQAALEGNAELLRQLAQVQEKLDLLIAKKKNRDRNQFGSKAEGMNPRPAEPAIKPSRLRSEKEEPLKFDIHAVPADASIPHQLTPEERICPHCNVETEFVANTVTRQLESVLRSIKIVEHLQETRSCRKCKSYIRTAAKPESPIPGSYASASLLATVVSDKVEDGLPNFRQQKRFLRESISIPRSTQCDWFTAMSLSVEPLYELIKREILKSEIIQTDDSMIKIQDRQHSKNIRKGKMTVCRGDDLHKFVCFIYSKNQSFESNKEFFKNYSGIIQADAAGGFDALFRKDSAGNGATEAGCNAHGRRKIFDAAIMEMIIATKMLDIYERLYEIEKRARKMSLDQRLAVRQKQSAPLMDQLHALHIENQQNFTPSHLLATAANYALKHWNALTLFLENPKVEIDNNASEREIKAFVLARKNFLFAGSDAGAKALAIHFTLIASAKRNGLNHLEYLADVFGRINQTKTSELHQFLPDRWKKPTR